MLAVAVLLAILIEPYRMERLTSFINPSADAGGAGFQGIQASIALGSGGVFGVGLGVLWLGERFTRVEALGAAIATVGVVVVAFRPGNYLRLGAILTLAGLGFLGFGIEPSAAAEWGYDLNKALSDVTSGIWWTSVFPGVAIVLTVLGVTLVGESLNYAGVYQLPAGVPWSGVALVASTLLFVVMGALRPSAAPR